MAIILLRFMDRYLFWLLNIILFPLKYIFNNQKYKLKPKKILVIRLWALWSSILTFPMITQLKSHYGEWTEYDILTTNRTINIFRNQWYFKNYINLFDIKDLIKLILSFKKYDIVIDTEEYFNISSLVSLWLWKINIWYSNLFTRRIVYNNFIIYNDKDHACLWYLDLLKTLNINILKPIYLEKFKYEDTDKLKVDLFLKRYNEYKLICLHTWWAETNTDRFWDKNNWINLINKLNSEKNIIFLSWTSFEETWILEIINSIDNNSVINICNKFNLKEYAYFLEKCNLMISNDTWPMHLSASMRTKTIWLFWPNLPIRFWAYPLNKNINLYHGDGNPTINVHLGKFKEDKNLFVNNITVDEVYNNIN